METHPQADAQTTLLLDFVKTIVDVSCINSENVSRPGVTWVQNIAANVERFVEQHPSPEKTAQCQSLGQSALNLFLQANVTGPPLTIDPATILLEPYLSHTTNTSTDARQKLRDQIISSLIVDGEAIYRLVANIELFALAKCLLDRTWPDEADASSTSIRWRIRINVWHQRLLSEVAPTIQESIYRDLDNSSLSSASDLLELSAIQLLHGFDGKARDALKTAARAREFQFVLTGRLGKRTKFQQHDLSQLVVLAKSKESEESAAPTSPSDDDQQLPQKLDLNDDTLLERIAFTGQPVEDADLPASLKSLDLANQPQLHPLDSTILLSHASLLIKSTAQDELSREEIMPYAERVLSGGSSNWQVYTQALLVKSRIEYHKSRTVERGVLQLQVLVDQTIAEITGDTDAGTSQSTARTFLPRAKQSESASVADRLKYIHQLASPTKWKLEAELAQQWVSLGGLRTALEIYERLEMWAEVALCYAASDHEKKARRIIRTQLYNSVLVTSTTKLLEDDADDDIGEYRIERDPLPADAPRLFCILGDIESSPAAYERAWEISNRHYARAKRSLAKYYLTQNEPLKAAEAYEESVKVNPQNHAAWFALGSVYLQLDDWAQSARAFSRAVQIDDTDAESWSNLAVALLKLSDEISVDAPDYRETQQKKLLESFTALKRAAALKRESYRIWQNYLTLAVKVVPPRYVDIVIAQERLIELRGATEGELCVDVPIMEALLSDMIAFAQDKERTASTVGHGIERMVTNLIVKKIVPLITASRRLWLLVARLNLFLNRPNAALMAYEKAWRSQLNQPSWDSSIAAETSERTWQTVVDSTIDLVDAYASLGDQKQEAGMGEGEPVAKDWKFKARSAVRSVLARGKEAWEDDEQYSRLSEKLEGLRG